LTTTAAWRWIALTIAAFSSGEVSGEAREMNPPARRGRQSPPAFADVSQHGCCFGIFGDLVRVGACEQELRVGRR
jgi:hypothetical protein